MALLFDESAGRDPNPLLPPPLCHVMSQKYHLRYGNLET